MAIRLVRSEDDPEGGAIRYISVTHDVSFRELRTWAVSQTPGAHVAVSVEHGGLSRAEVRKALATYVDLTAVDTDE